MLLIQLLPNIGLVHKIINFQPCRMQILQWMVMFKLITKESLKCFGTLSHDQSSCMRVLGRVICKVVRMKTKLRLIPRNWSYQDCEKCVSDTHRNQVQLAQEGGNMNIKYCVHSDRVTQVLGSPYMPQLLYIATRFSVSFAEFSSSFCLIF